jgi:hypothetical protein
MEKEKLRRVRRPKASMTARSGFVDGAQVRWTNGALVETGAATPGGEGEGVEGEGLQELGSLSSQSAV